MNLSAVDLNLLVVLDALLREGSVTGAARRVGLSQPAVSNALARLRAVIGDPLFVRSGRGLVATARARALAAPVARGLAELGGALDPPAPFEPKRVRRRFTIAMPDIAELVLLPPLAARLRREAPGIELAITARDPDLTVTMLDGDSPHQSPLFDLRFVCLVRRDHPRVGTRLSLSRFLDLDHVLVGGGQGGGPGGVIDDLLARRGLDRRVVLRLGHFFTAAMVVSRSDLVMSATSILAATVARILPVRAVRHPIAAAAVTIGQRWRPEHDRDPAHRYLRDLVAEVASRVPRSGPGSRPRRGTSSTRRGDRSR